MSDIDVLTVEEDEEEGQDVPEEDEKEKREKRLAPYRALHTQQAEQDELIADLLYWAAMKDLEG